MMKGVCYIVGAGDFYGDISINGTDILIAADGGYDKLLGLGLVPHILIGDLDSIKEVPKDIEIIRYPVQKDETDMFLAYKIGLERGYKSFVIYGGVGGREDHTFANYSLLLHAKNDSNSAVLVGHGTKTYVIKNEKAELYGKCGKTVSVFAFGADASGVDIKGLKYETENATITCDFPLGVSNSFTESGTGSIFVRNGALLVIEEVEF